MITYLIDQRFGVNGPGVALSAERRSRKDNTIATAIAKYEKGLRALSPEDLGKLYAIETKKKIAQNKTQSEADEADRFFNKPHAGADFDHWSKAAYWSLDEAVALSLGKAPERVSWKVVESYTQVSAFALNYARRRDLARRAVSMNQLTDGVYPGFFLGWAKRNEFQVPEELVRLVEKKGQFIGDYPNLLKNAHDKLEETLVWANGALKIGGDAMEKLVANNQTQIAERDQKIAELTARVEELASLVASNPVGTSETLNPKSRLSLLKLVLGMAIDGYGFDPKESKSPFAKETVDRLATLGITIDEDTVRRWLREAAGEVNYISPIGSKDG